MSEFGFDLKIPREGDVNDIAAEIFQQELQKLTRVIANGLDDAATQMVIAHLETKGYVIVGPTRTGLEADALRQQGRQLRLLEARNAELVRMLEAAKS